jgi:hypothetical protein
MEFLKKHYEKILLGLVLAGLIGVLVFMLFYISTDKQSMEDRANSLTHPKVTKLPDIDLTVQGNAIARQQSPYLLDFETVNKLFNPLEWQRGLDGTLIPAAKKTGLQMAVVTNIAPLYLIITFDSILTNELGARYVVGVEKQAAPTKAKSLKHQHYVSVGDKANDTFSLDKVQGAVENPDALVLKLVDTGELATVSRDKPYRRVDAHTADFRYDPEKKIFRARRIGDKVSFGGVDYLVVEVNQNELILSDQSNQKKTSLPFAP